MSKDTHFIDTEVEQKEWDSWDDYENDTYKIKPEIGYNKERGCIEPFKVCSIGQMIYQTEESLHPEEILADKSDILEVKNALRITVKF